MAQIDFYVVKDSAAEAWLRYTCRLVEKAYLMGLHVHIHTADDTITDAYNLHTKHLQCM